MASSNSEPDHYSLPASDDRSVDKKDVLDDDSFALLHCMQVLQKQQTRRPTADLLQEATVAFDKGGVMYHPR